MTERDIEPIRLRGINATDGAKLSWLVDSMSRSGWTKRRILVEESDRGLYVWTGTHRAKAATIAGVKTVPCAVIEQQEANHAFGKIYGDRYGYSCWRDKVTAIQGSRDEHRLVGLERAGLTQAADVLREEMQAEEG